MGSARKVHYAAEVRGTKRIQNCSPVGSPIAVSASHNNTARQPFLLAPGTSAFGRFEGCQAACKGVDKVFQQRSRQISPLFFDDTHEGALVRGLAPLHLLTNMCRMLPMLFGSGLLGSSPASRTPA